MPFLRFSFFFTFHAYNFFKLQTILYVSDEYLDVATFPRYYLYPQKWNQLRLARQIISMLPNSPYCSNSTEAIGRGTCLVNSWLKSRIVNPLNCTLFYFQHKFPNLPVCRPEAIVKTYKNVIDLAFNDDTGVKKRRKHFSLHFKASFYIFF